MLKACRFAKEHELAHHVATKGADVHLRVHGSAQRYTVLLQPLLLLCRFKPEVNECAGSLVTEVRQQSCETSRRGSTVAGCLLSLRAPHRLRYARPRGSRAGLPDLGQRSRHHSHWPSLARFHVRGVSFCHEARSHRLGWLMWLQYHCRALSPNHSILGDPFYRLLTPSNPRPPAPTGGNRLHGASAHRRALFGSLLSSRCASLRCDS